GRADRPREVRVPRARLVRHQAVEAAGFVVDEEELAVGLLGERDDARGGARGFDAVSERRALDRVGEVPPRLPIAVEIPALEALQLRAVIDVAAGHRGR